MEEMDRAQRKKEPGAPVPSPGCPSPLTCTCSPTQKLSEPRSFGLLWRLHYIGGIDYIIGHW